jgi:hypothetical protein
MTSRLVICCPVCPLNVINNCGGGGGGPEFLKYPRHPLFMFGLRNAALQTGLGRLRELLFLDLYFGLLAPSRDPNLKVHKHEIIWIFFLT